MDMFDEIMRLWSYPRPGHIQNYRVISEDDYDIVPKKGLLLREIQNLESAIDTRKRLREAALERYDKEIKELEDELQKQKKRLNP
jgi:hypothetical protein